MTLRYTVEPANAGHRTSILSLWQVGYGSPRAERFDWIYGGETEAMFALARDEQGHVVGMNGLQPRRISIDGTEHMAGLVQELVVEPSYRSAGPAVRLQRELTGAGGQAGMVALYGFPLRAAEPIQRRAGFREMGQRERWVRPLRAEYLLEKAGIRHPVVQRLLATPANLLLRLTSLRPSRCRRWSSEILEEFDARFDALWERAKSQFPVMGERTARYLSWRFGQRSGERAKIVAVSDECGELRAYAIYAVQGQTAVIRDLAFGDEPALDRVLDETLRHARREGLWAVSFQFFGGGPVSTALKRRGFSRRPHHSPLFIHCPAGAPNANWEHWYLTEAD